jgi:hypothetical protein
MGLKVPLYGMGVTVGDFDNDGWVDIFVTAIGGCKLFRNDGGKRFVDVTAEAGVGGGGVWPEGLSRDDFLKLDKPIPWPTSATFLDFDGDGKLDLFVCHYVTWSPASDLDNKYTMDGVGRAYGAPTGFQGAQCTLYRNVDGRHFEDVSEKVGLRVIEPDGIGPNARKRNVAKALGVVVCDPDEDGWPDLIVANDTVRNFFFHNVPGPNGVRQFEEIGLKVGMAYAEGAARGGMGIDWGEYRPGFCASIVANFSDEPISFFGQEKSKRLSFSDAALLRAGKIEAIIVLRRRAGGRHRRAKSGHAEVRHLLLRLRSRWPARHRHQQRSPRAGNRKGPPETDLCPAAAIVLEHGPGARQLL